MPRSPLSAIVSDGRTKGEMKNANIFVDVDLTLVDAEGELLAGAREGLEALRDSGCHLFLWSTAGTEYARGVAQRHGLSHLFEAFSAKPDIIIEDMPSTAVAPFVFTVREGAPWQSVVQEIIARHVD